MAEVSDFWYNTLMLRVEINIPHPLETLCLLLAAGGVMLWMAWDVPQSASMDARSPAEGRGGGGADREARVLAFKSAEDDARRIRLEQAVLARREEILRYQLQVLETEASRVGNDDAVRAAKTELLSLLGDTRAAEQKFLETLREMWEAEGLSAAAAMGSPGVVRMLWPVEPERGLSAGFLDAAYEQRFGIPHHAIDIPVSQGSAVRSAADGVVEKVVDNGLGYSFILVKHDGFATLYGHVSGFFVAEGDEVRQGDVLGASGGMPGTPGAGAISTGPHLHFEVIAQGERIDPLTVLPARTTVRSGGPSRPEVDQVQS